MDPITIIIAIATVVPAIYGTIQLWEWWVKRRKRQKRNLTLSASAKAVEGNQNGIKIVNFTHPLTPIIIKQIEQVLEQQIEDVKNIKTQLNEDKSFDEQIQQLVDEVGFSSDEWQTGKFLVHVPGFAPAASALLAELHGRMGHFPTILRLRAIENTTPRQFELAEIINLQSMRDASREKR